MRFDLTPSDNSFTQFLRAACSCHEVATSTVVTKTTVTSASDTAEEGTPEARWNDAVALSKKRRAEAESKVCTRALSKSFFDLWFTYYDESYF